VSKAVVIAHGNNGGPRDLVAYFESNQPGVTATSLRYHLSASVPSYMVPSSLIRLTAVPVLPNGKVDRTALPAPASLSDEAGHAAPRNDREAQLVGIWRDVLGRDGIGIEDRFFESGGDSIKAIQIVSRLRSAGYDVDMRHFFASPTIAALAAVLDAGNGHRKAPAPSLSARVSLTAEEETELFAND
jgi:aryl carrier-like protein